MRKLLLILVLFFSSNVFGDKHFGEWEGLEGRENAISYWIDMGYEVLQVTDNPKDSFMVYHLTTFNKFQDIKAIICLVEKGGEKAPVPQRTYCFVEYY